MFPHLPLPDMTQTNGSTSGNGGTEPVYVISVAARLAGLPCWVLRVLDQEQIVVPVRTDSNRRLYCDNDIALLARVRYLTEERGVNVAGVKVILEMEGRVAVSAAAPAPAHNHTPPVAGIFAAPDREGNS